MILIFIFNWKIIFICHARKHYSIFVCVCVYAGTLQAMINLLKCLFLKFKEVILQLITFIWTYLQKIYSVCIQFFLFKMFNFYFAYLF